MTITRSERWHYDRGFDRDIVYARIDDANGRTIYAFLFDVPLLMHEFQRTAGDRVPILIDEGGDVRVCGYTWPIYITRDDMRSMQVTR